MNSYHDKAHFRNLWVLVLILSFPGDGFLTLMRQKSLLTIIHLRLRRVFLRQAAGSGYLKHKLPLYFPATSRAECQRTNGCNGDAIGDLCITVPGELTLQKEGLCLEAICTRGQAELLTQSHPGRSLWTAYTDTSVHLVEPQVPFNQAPIMPVRYNTQACYLWNSLSNDAANWHLLIIRDRLPWTWNSTTLLNPLSNLVKRIMYFIITKMTQGQ